MHLLGAGHVVHLAAGEGVQPRAAAARALRRDVLRRCGVRSCNVSHCVTLLSLMLGRGRWPPTSGITSTTMFWRAAAARVTTAPWRPHTAHTAWSAITCTGRMPAASCRAE